MKKYLIILLLLTSCAFGGLDCMRISSDGKYAFITSWDNGNFSVISLSGGGGYRDRYTGGNGRTRYGY